ncbi:hypothetical protein OWR29_16965 [Actinoplanes sp. Pm04-4]|jgi:hypothetical protein|uniref:Uncharacterized protein n=1 Tax=Paractinoplanes pyxinae TaxID=2997416 RepID=A0ABT4AZR7_9ACTN|nr:hypothetical protein [Actinoplanes pyxinae]MCY1139694.1 hypothetical protein [Actinoplanes pyxinae]
MAKGHGVGRVVRRLLSLATLRQSDPGYGSTEIDITLQRTWPANWKAFRCRRCDGVKWAAYAPTCLGIRGAHQWEPEEMKTANSSTAGPDTPELKIQE